MSLRGLALAHPEGPPVVKLKKAIATLDAQKHNVTFPTFNATNGFETFSRNLRDVVIANLPALGSESYDATRTWDFDEDTEEFFFSFEIGLRVEVEAALDEDRTKACAVRAVFSFNPRAADLETVISALDDDIRRFKAGLVEMRKLQLDRVLMNEGQDAWKSAKERSL